MPQAEYGTAQRACEECQQQYEPYVTTQRWCSPKCRQRGKNRVIAERRKAGTLGKRRSHPSDPCRQCGGQKEHSVRKNALCKACRYRSDSEVQCRKVEREYMAAMKRDPCAYCGGEADALDHIEPYSEGGPDTWMNRTPTCKSCNSTKSGSSLLAFLLYERLLEDTLPTMRQMTRLGRSFGISQRWLGQALQRKGY